MNRSRRLTLAIALAFAFVALDGACSLLLKFDPENQACSESGECLPGYICRVGKCAKIDGQDACGGCGEGKRCIASTATCVPNTCEFKKCWAGSHCVDNGGTPTCQSVGAPGLGQLCTDDLACVVDGGTANRVC